MSNVNVKDIIQGHINEFMGKNEELAIERMSICRACPLGLESTIGLMCDPDLWINPETNETSTYSKDGYVRGCGCRLAAKTTLPDNHCIINKW